MKIFSSVSAILLSEVAITSPLRPHEGFQSPGVREHTASCRSIETGQRVSGIASPVGRNEIDRLRAFHRRHLENDCRSPAICGEFRACSCIAATLAMLSLMNRTFKCGDRL
jgi:hypothetical protein